MEMQVSDRQANEYWVLKRLGGNFTVEKKGGAVQRTVSQNFIWIGIKKKQT